MENEVNVSDIFCEYWKLFFEDDGTILASTMFSFNYDTETGMTRPESYNALTIYLQNQKEVRREWSYEEKWRDHVGLKEKVLAELEEKQMFETLEMVVNQLPHFDSRDEIIEGECVTPSYNPNSNEFWFEIKGIPAKFMMLHSNSGGVINHRMILDKYPENHVFLDDLNHHFLTYYKERSTRRLYFLFQK
jgi:hypothetical protein